jgi:signal recognition particle receptor subunit beta
MSAFDGLDTVLVAAAIIIISILILVSKFKGSAKGDSILIAGVCNSGKTALFFQLRDGDATPRETVMSMNPNKGVFIPAALAKRVKKPLTYIDFPGTGSKRPMLSAMLPSVRAVVFVVDASSEADLIPASKYLYALLTDRILRAKRVPVLIAASKTDVSSSFSAKGVENRMTKLLDIARSVRDDMPDLDASRSAPLNLGQEGVPFAFAHSAMPVSVTSISLTGLDSLYLLYIIIIITIITIIMYIYFRVIYLFIYFQKLEAYFLSHFVCIYGLSVHLDGCIYV